MEAATLSRWAERALEHVRELTRYARSPATAGEERAARYVSQQLNSLGIADVRRQPFLGLRSDFLFLALALGVALIGHAAFWLLRPPLGMPLALGVSLAAFGFSAFLFWRKYTYRSYPLEATLPHGPSQNVVAVLPAAQERHHTVVFLGHLDVHRAAWWYANDLLTGAYLLATPFVLGGLLVSPLLYALGLKWAALPFAVLHFLGWFTGVTADLGPASPGANDNASAVGTLLALGEHLRAEPLAHTEVWLAFTGCEEVGAQGMMALLDEYGTVLKEALFVDFEMVGIGERLVYMQQEGIVRPKRITADVESLVRQVGGALDLEPLGAGGLGALTEIGVALERGHRGVCFLSRRAESRFPPEWHRLTDVPGRLEPAALGRIHALAWRLLEAVEGDGDSKPVGQ